MILLWGLEEDRTFQSVLNVLRKRDAEFTFVNHASIASTSVKFSTTPTLSYFLTVGDNKLDLDSFSAAYLRPYDHRLYEEGTADPRPTLGGPDVVYHLLMSWAEHTKAIIINRPSADATNHSKLFQSVTIRECGFSVPESLVSNDLVSIREFEAKHGSLIYKSMSCVRSIVKVLDTDALANLGSFGPILVQQRIRGTNLRVHVVGSSVVACQSNSTAIDYRYAECRMEACELPTNIAAQCVDLTKRLGLIVSGIDLMRAEDGQYYCLEANPNPAFGAYDHDGMSSVAHLVVDRLMESNKPLQMTH